MSDLEALAQELERLRDEESEGLPRLGPRHHPWGRRDWIRRGRVEAFIEAAKLVREMAAMPTAHGSAGADGTSDGLA